jgi:hypothetical protein
VWPDDNVAIGCPFCRMLVCPGLVFAYWEISGHLGCAYEHMGHSTPVSGKFCLLCPFCLLLCLFCLVCPILCGVRVGT